MSTRTDDALNSWLADLTGGETSMRRLRKRLTEEGTLTTEPCPTCQHPATTDVAHTGHWVAEPVT
ncbi:hypothetical protein IN07_06300 [Modestobacter caceresii]|uniref:Uncharacterized protein n=1 Tax=Modestobacter caceresii TaxID=1522368 RepID=A0A098YB41_9ACTN|nr:hypothetical protein [Modestobacter caceresii]KGH47605.1 hypothetical protein IN07_06300 [Modestobacter caceresii]